MRRNNIKVGLDVGSSQVRIVIASAEENGWRVLGSAKVPCHGLRKGVVVDIEETTKAIAKAASIVEGIAGVPVERALVNIDGSHLAVKVAKSMVAVSRANGEISQEDVDRVLSNAESTVSPENSPNREILHVIPRYFSIDNQSEIRDPVGMNGGRLDADTLIVTGSTPFIKNLSKCIDQAGIAIEGLVAAPLAAAESSLNRRQKELGVAVIDIGVGTTGISVFEDDQLVYTAVLPIGAGHITNDIAIGLKTSIEVAEKVKVEYGSASPQDISPKKEINLSKISKNEEGIIKAREIAEIVEARMEEIFNLANKELHRIKKAGMLPAGIVLVGGGSKLASVAELAKKVMKLPAQVGFPVRLGGISESLEDPSWATAVGLILWENDENRAGGGGSVVSNATVKAISDKFFGFFDGSGKKSIDWLKTFLP